jgi:thiazole/oxazole-forming peptide maturase SagD family component
VRAGGAAADPLTPGELDALDATRPHRLGAIQSVSAPARVKIAGAAPSIVRVRYASSNLRLPAVGWAHGAETDPEHAALVARAEGAERHAAGRTSAVELRRAEPHALDAEAIGSEAFWAPNDRQARALAAPPDGVPPLWAAARTATGERRWVPAAQVLLPFTDPQRPDPRPGATSSGVAAYTDEAGAAERGLLELVERDALMWHWIQQVTPRRLTEAPLPEPVRDQLAAVRAVGWEPFLLDLSLDTVPVVLALLRRGERLAIGLSAARRVEPAAAKALGEALMIGRLDVDEPLAPVADPAAVTTPEDHLALHHHPDHAHAHRFLLAGDEVDPRELAAPDEPLAELVRPIGEPLFVRFDAPAVRPFVVVRALVPGIVPITFGHDLEPLGLRRAAAPIRTRDGRTLGGELDLRETGPLLPHPFP